MGRQRKWRAKWIWAAGDGREKNVYYYFRREFSLDGRDGEYRVYIAADTRYQLFIDGRFVGRGAPQSQPFHQYYDEHIVTRYLRAGVNCLAVVVYHLGTLADTRGGLLAELVGEGGGAILGTDASWRVARAEAWQQDTYAFRGNQVAPYQEFFDARKVPQGWDQAGFDDRAWQPATVIQGRQSDRVPTVLPWSKLVLRDIPFMTAEPVLASRIEKVEESLDIANRSRPNDLAPGLSMVGNPLRYTRVENAENLLCETGTTVVQSSLCHENLDFDGLYAPAIVLDFGRVITAHLRLELEGEAGGMVDIGYAERLIDGYFNIALEGEFADRYILRSGRQTFESFNWRSFRYVKLRFRYCDRPVTIHRVLGIVSTYPYKQRGSFHSGDERLNAVFRICRDTVQLCSNEFLMDTPWREQAQWLGDVALVTVPCIYACFGDTALPGKFFRQAAANQHPTGMLSNISNVVNHHWQDAHADYSLWWVQGLWNHYMYTGEAGWIHSLYPQALHVIYAHLDYVNDKGLIEDMPYRIFIDWADVDRRGECAAYNAIFYGTLKAVLRMAQLKNDAYTVALAEQAMRAIKSCFQRRFFDPRRGCFADANVDDELSPKVSEHANMAAINWGLCDEATGRAIVAAFYEKRSVRFTEAQPFFMAVVLSALDRLGRFDLALELIRERWGRRMVDKGLTSTLEEWYQNGSWRDGTFKGFLRTHSHAWSAIPAAFLIHNLTGFEILEPGCARVALSPQRTPFDYEVSCPTPRGDVRVRCKQGVITVEAPDGVRIQECRREARLSE